jgi:hypothetical protein
MPSGGARSLPLTATAKSIYRRDRRSGGTLFLKIIRVEAPSKSYS